MTKSFSHEQVSIFFLTSLDFENISFTYRNWSCGSLKSLDGSTANLFLFSFRTSRELEMFSKQPGSRTLILLLLKFLQGKMSNSPQCIWTRNVIINEHKMSLLFSYRYFSCIVGKDPALISEMELDVRSRVSKETYGCSSCMNRSEIRLWTLNHKHNIKSSNNSY